MATNSLFHKPQTCTSLQSETISSAANSLTGSIADAIMSGANNYYLIISALNKIGFISPSLADLLQLDAEGLTGTRINEFALFQSSPSQFDAALKRARDGVRAQCILEHPVSDPKSIPSRCLELSFTPVPDDEKKACGVVLQVEDQTEWVQLKNELYEIRKKLADLSAVTDEFPGSIALYDAEEKLIWHNLNYAHIHSFPPGKLISGLTFRECLLALLKSKSVVECNGMTVESYEHCVDQYLPGLQCSSGPVELHCTSGRWISLALQLLPDGRFLETLTDISAQKYSEIEIREERNLLRSLIDNIPDYIYAKDPAGKFIVRNRSVIQYMDAVRKSSLGLTDSPGERATDFDFYKPELAQAYRREDLRVIRQGESIENHEVRTSPENENESIWISTSKAPLLDTEGNIIGLVGTSRNITEEKLAEAGMLESNERFRDFAETAAELFWETDKHFNITYISERYPELTGHLPQSILGRSARRIIPRLVNAPESIDRVDRLLGDKQMFSELEIRIRQKSGAPRQILLSGKPRFDVNGEFIGYRGAGRDITKARTLEKKLQYQASHDELTKLPNRREFMRRLGSELRASLSENTLSVLGYLDLDQFKIVNDSVGHIAGDALLVQATNLIKSQLRKSDTVARLGGDEFGVLIHDQTVDDAIIIFQRIIEQFETFRFRWNSQLFGIGISIGLVSIGESHADASELMSRADVACFAAKDAGRGRVHVYRAQVSNRSLQHKQLLMAAGIRNSIATNRFQLYSQPITTTSGSGLEILDIRHYEILLRLSGEDGKIMMPGTFIPAAERYGLMGEIDRWVVSQALKKLSESNKFASDITVSINLSGQSLTDKTLADFTKAELRKYTVDPASICFEITETAAIGNLSVAQTFIKEMKELGCKFALDDFGSGFSSLGYLKYFDIDYLKIDGGFIRDIATDQTDQIMVASINQIGKSLGLATVAEYVEKPESVDVLKKIGVDMLQGYCVGKPVPLDTVFPCTTE